MSPITECFVVMETDLEGHVTLHGMFLDSSDAFGEVMQHVREEEFKEEIDENDRTIWTGKTSRLEIKPCPCHLELP